MRKIIFALFILISNFLLSQNLSSNIVKYYEFSLCNSPLTIILQEKKKNKYSGIIYAYLEKKKKRSYKKIKKKIKISFEQAEKIILELEKAKIDFISENYEDYSLVYLDGDYLSVKLLKYNKI
ncbi:hypothetical protein B0A69_20540 [Chryseobacterium shigense]|uniref:Uncharacterized protein n=1 Tax=Chryseobacterium shigense TaxID=297244 RepID=A0A1N7KI13_9FLAO|nr:hypothetical protein [Chryseobacterium shigense]PQA90329.1 hypothetical protein B0A69_20540 [Chryseobacterium shigense]SIS61197.1 hypothetical protein SAMN05421639_11115 [Chryseobacterium shigense]